MKSEVMETTWLWKELGLILLMACLLITVVFLGLAAYIFLCSV